MSDDATAPMEESGIKMQKQTPKGGPMTPEREAELRIWAEPEILHTDIVDFPAMLADALEALDQARAQTIKSGEEAEAAMTELRGVLDFLLACNAKLERVAVAARNPTPPCDYKQ